VTDIIVSSGQTLSGATLASLSDTIQVLDGGALVSALIALGDVFVSSGGEAIDSLLTSSGAVETSETGGFTSGATVAAGGAEIVSGAAFGLTVGEGGKAQVWNGGLISGASIASGGSVNVIVGSATDVTVSSGGLLIAGAGQLDQITLNAGSILSVGVYGQTVALVGGTRLVLTDYGGATTDTINLAGSTSGLVYNLAPGVYPFCEVLVGSGYTVASGVVSSGLQLGSGDVVTVTGGGVAVAAAIGVRASEILSSGAVDSGAVVDGWETVLSGAVASATTVDAGSQTVSSGGLVVNDTIQSGGYATIYGVVSGAIVASDGQLSVAGVASGAVASQGGGIYVDGQSFGDVISSGGIEEIYNSGTANGSVVLSGGTELIQGPGVASGTVVSSGGTVSVGFGTIEGLVAMSGATIVLPESATSLVSSGHQLEAVSSRSVYVIAVVGLAAAPTDASFTLNADGSEILVGSAHPVSSGVTSEGLTIDGGDSLVVLLGGLATGNSIVTAGAEVISNGGLAEGEIVSGGLQTVLSGGSSISATITGSSLFSATGLIDDFGTVSGAVVGGGGQAIIEPGGIANGVTVQSGGEASISSGGVLDDPIVQDGGYSFISLGGIQSGGEIQSGGMVVIERGGVLRGATLMNGAKIDLPGIAGAVARADGNGNLIVTSGGSVLDSIPLGPTSGVRSYATTPDSLGGTFITAEAAPVTIVPSDYNGDALSDLTWRNTNGDAGIWLTTSGGGLTPVNFGVIDNSWVIQGGGDFNGDGKADILWRNTATGQVGEWLSKPGSGYSGFTTPVIGAVATSWKIDGVGDFNGDGLGDLVWRNTNGDAGLWLTTSGGGFTPIDFGVITNNWQIQGAGDFNGDGKADLLWRNTVTGQVGEWLSKPGSGYQGFTTPILATVDLSWKVQGVGDFSGDGLSDILWRNTNGDTGIWVTTSGGSYTPIDFGVISLNWRIQGVGDYNGDGKADILWRNTATGQVGEWLSKPGTGYTGFTTPILATVDPSWKLQGVPPTLQPNLVGSSVATFAQAMASLGSESSHAAGVTPGPLAPSPVTPLSLPADRAETLP
jgi:autotransporter passenger strand-loop-strand repeat protein